MLTTDRLAEFLVLIEAPVKIFLMFMVFVYVIWFWKVGPYDGMMTTLNSLKVAIEKTFLAIYGLFVWIFQGISRIFRVVFATVRDFFISRI